MSINDILIKAEELTGLINNATKEVSSAENNLDKINEQIKSQLDIISKNNDIINESDAKVNELKEAIKNEQNEIERQKNIWATNVSTSESVLKEANSFKEYLKQEEVNLVNLQTEAKSRFQEGIDKIEKANITLQEAFNIKDETERRIVNSKIEERENNLISREKTADDKLNEAIAKEQKNGLVENSLNAQIASVLAKETYLNIKIKQNEDRERDLIGKEESLNSDKAALASKELDLQYTELRLNKIIKEKNISDILNVK